MIAVIELIITIAVTGVIGFVIVNKTLTKAKHKDIAKKEVVPRVSMPEPGICQCNDALCYHAAGPCSVRNCPCVMYVDSSLSHTEIMQASGAPIARLAIETAQAREKYELAEEQAQRREKEAQRQMNSYR